MEGIIWNICIIYNIIICQNYLKNIFFLICSSGADFLGPLLPAVAEICSDFDPTVDVEPSLMKLFRNLWFYIALFGLAPPILRSPVSVKPNSTTLNNGGNTTAVALQAVGGPYMWNPQWSSAVQRISQGTPPLVCNRWLYFYFLKLFWSLSIADFFNFVL